MQERLGLLKQGDHNYRLECRKKSIKSENKSAGSVRLEYCLAGIARLFFFRYVINLHFSGLYSSIVLAGGAYIANDYRTKF